MARYIGPRVKISKRFGEPILKDIKMSKKKSFGTSKQGGRRRRQKSEYAIQLAEKQKAKYIYGVLEKQFENTFSKASKKKGITGEILLQMLESRLDNTVYRFGVALTRRSARQLVLHNHILVNGVVVNIPSYSLRPKDKVEVRERSKSLEVITKSLDEKEDKKYSWLEWSKGEMSGQVLSVPEREAIPENINEQLIVELYSK